MKCPFCTKVFKSDRGLKCHVTKSHKQGYIDRLDHSILLYQILPFVSTNDLLKFLPLLPELMSYDDYWLRKIKEENMYNLERKLPGDPSPAEAFLKLSPGKCYHCRTRTQAVNHFYGFYLCRECQKCHDCYTCHTQQGAREEFCLSNKDLQGLSCYRVKNPHYSCAPPMKLYLASDLEKKAIEKYGDVSKEKAKREASRVKRRGKKENEKKGRENLLIQALGELDLTLRDDSTLCEEFIKGSLSMSANEVASEMAYMKYLYEFTDYRKRVEAEVYCMMEENGGYYPKGVWRVASDIVKSHCFVKPQTWPWLAGYTA